MPLTREEFESAIPFKTKLVDLPDGVQVIVSELSVKDAEELDAKNFPIGPDQKTTVAPNGHDVRWAIACLRNPDGSRMYTDADFDRVSGFSPRILAAIANGAREVNGVGSGTNPVESAAKNS